MAEARPDDHEELYEAFARLVAAGEGYPQAPGPITVGEFDDYWLEHKSLVGVARLGDDLAGLRGRGIGETLASRRRSTGKPPSSTGVGCSDAGPPGADDYAVSRSRALRADEERRSLEMALSST